MLYMSGGGVQILNKGIVLTLLFTPFENIVGMNAGVLLCLSVRTMLIFRRSVCSIRHLVPQYEGHLAFKGWCRPHAMFSHCLLGYGSVDRWVYFQGAR